MKLLKENNIKSYLYDIKNIKVKNMNTQNYKFKICKFFLNNKCKFGFKCSFEHLNLLEIEKIIMKLLFFQKSFFQDSLFFFIQLYLLKFLKGYSIRE